MPKGPKSLKEIYDLKLEEFLLLRDWMFQMERWYVELKMWLWHLSSLGERIRRPLQRLSNATTIDEPLLNDCVAEFALALLKADVQFKLVHDMHANIKKIIKIHDLVASKDKRKIIQEAVFNELCTILDSGKPSFIPEKGKTSVVMFVGLQGFGKTTACTKYAYYHLKKGYKPALVCADTFTADAFDQLKQNATIAKIPLHGSYTESDPVRIAVEGVERFKKENWDLIIVDTSGHYKQEASLFEETRQVYEKTKPDLVIFVIDSSTGQAAYDQVQAFKQSVPVGAVIVTKMDGHVKGGGTLTAVAATKSPVIFIETGKHMNEFEVFDVKSFVSRLLGIGDWFVREVVPMGQRPDLLRTISEGNFTLRDMHKMIQCVLQDGPRQTLSKFQGKFPGKWMPGDAEEIEARLEKRSAIFESMTDEELDSSILKRINESRIRQIATGCGYPITDVMEMLEAYKKVAKHLRMMKEVRSLRMMEVGYAKLLRPYRA